MGRVYMALDPAAQLLLPRHPQRCFPCAAFWASALLSGGALPGAGAADGAWLCRELEARGPGQEGGEASRGGDGL